MPTVLTTRAVEQSTYVVQASFTDEDGNAVVPNTLTWTLTNDEGTVINSHESVVITPATTVNIVLSGDDLALSANDDGNRIVTIEGTYDSSYGNDLPLKDSCQFVIVDLTAIV